MNKDLKKIQALIEEKKKQQREIIEKADVELKTAKKECEEIQKQLDAVNTADNYKELLQKKRDAEDVVKFFQKRLNETSKIVIEKADAQSIRARIEKINIDETEKARADIDKCIMEFIAVMKSYESILTDLNTAETELNGLSGENVNRTFDTRTLTGGDLRRGQYLEGYKRAQNIEYVQRGRP